MAWTNDIPPLPTSINDIRGDSLRQQAQDAWRAAHTIRNAIDQWEAWLDQARKGKVDFEAGDSIIRDGATAIDVLCNLGIRGMPFNDPTNDEEQDRPLWPWAPSDNLDPSFYDGSEPAYQQEINRERGYLVFCLRPAVEEMLRLLAESPEAAIADKESGPALEKERHLAAAQRKKVAEQKLARQKKVNLARELWDEYDPADVKVRGYKAVHKEIGEIMQQRLVLPEPIKPETVRDYLKEKKTGEG